MNAHARARTRTPRPPSVNAHKRCASGDNALASDCSGIQCLLHPAQRGKVRDEQTATQGKHKHGESRALRVHGALALEVVFNAVDGERRIRRHRQSLDLKAQQEPA